MDKILSKEKGLLRRYALPQQGGGALAATSTQYARAHAAPHHELTPSERIGLHYTPLALYWSPIRMPAANPKERGMGVAAAAARAAADAADAAVVLSPTLSPTPLAKRGLAV